jgi:muramoyltetrapeptide carboxypeptidase
MRPLKPPRLRRGDVIGLVAPASPTPNPKAIPQGVRYLESLGYHVKAAPHLMARHGFLAGTDAQRAADLNALFRDPDVKAIFSLRGGYGSPRILSLVDYTTIRRHPKILVGFSDITALQLALFRKTGLVSVSGPLVATDFIPPVDPFTEEHFWRLVTSTHPIGPLPPAPQPPLITLQTGSINAPLIPANLALLTSLLGTPYLPRLHHTLLVLEDVGESPHRLDRMFTQLRNAGCLTKIAGLILGQFTRCHPTPARAPHLSFDQIVRELIPHCTGPVAQGLAYGHLPGKISLPIGLPARFNTRHGRLVLPEAAVS